MFAIRNAMHFKFPVVSEKTDFRCNYFKLLQLHVFLKCLSHFNGAIVYPSSSIIVHILALNGCINKS